MDHVHLVIDLGINLSVSKLMQLLKGVSSRKLLKAFPWLRTEYFWGGHFWSPAYYFDSVGDMNCDVIRDYVKKQEIKGEKQRDLLSYMPPTSVGGC